MKTYVGHGATIAECGQFLYEPLTVEEAMKWLKNNDWKSLMGYEDTAIAMGYVLEVKPEVSHDSIVPLDVDDQILVFRLRKFLPSWIGDNEEKAIEWAKNNCQIRLLTRVM